MKYATLAPAPVGSFGAIVTVPGGRKFEVLQVSPSTFGGAATTFYVARTLGGATFFTDHVAMAAGTFDATRQYHDLVLEAGDVLLVGFIGAGAGGEAAVVDYVDVAPA